jgi:hypothetical protein
MLSMKAQKRNEKTERKGTFITGEGQCFGKEREKAVTVSRCGRTGVSKWKVGC